LPVPAFHLKLSGSDKDELLNAAIAANRKLGGRLRLLLTMNLPYDPALGGANKANKAVVEQLADLGHKVCIVAPAAPEHSVKTAPSTRKRPNLLVHNVDTKKEKLTVALKKCIQSFVPEIILVSSEDPVQALLYEALKTPDAQVVYLVHSPNCLPFGPLSFFPSQRGTSLLARVSLVIAVSEFAASYVEQWSSIRPERFYFPAYGLPPFAFMGSFAAPYITMVNPSSYKGIDIFLRIAELRPHWEFMAIPSWGTTEEDLQRLASLPNIEIREADVNIESALAGTKILVVPSLFLENFSMVVVEALLRGIPVVASEVGGMREAKLGTNHLIPVMPIRRFEKHLDQRGLLIAEVLPQDADPWLIALEQLCGDERIFIGESELGRDRATDFVSRLSISGIEERLMRLIAMRCRQ